jgi:hypothetical protein
MQPTCMARHATWRSPDVLYSLTHLTSAPPLLPEGVFFTADKSRTYSLDLKSAAAAHSISLAELTTALDNTLRPLLPPPSSIGVSPGGSTWHVQLHPDCPHYAYVSSYLNNGGSFPLSLPLHNTIVCIPVKLRYLHRLPTTRTLLLLNIPPCISKEALPTAVMQMAGYTAVFPSPDDDFPAPPPPNHVLITRIRHGLAPGGAFPNPSTLVVTFLPPLDDPHLSYLPPSFTLPGWGQRCLSLIENDPLPKPLRPQPPPPPPPPLRAAAEPPLAAAGEDLPPSLDFDIEIAPPDDEQRPPPPSVPSIHASHVLHHPHHVSAQDQDLGLGLGLMLPIPHDHILTSPTCSLPCRAPPTVGLEGCTSTAAAPHQPHPPLPRALSTTPLPPPPPVTTADSSAAPPAAPSPPSSSPLPSPPPSPAPPPGDALQRKLAAIREYNLRRSMAPPPTTTTPTPEAHPPPTPLDIPPKPLTPGPPPPSPRTENPGLPPPPLLTFDTLAPIPPADSDFSPDDLLDPDPALSDPAATAAAAAAAAIAAAGLPLAGRLPAPLSRPSSPPQGRLCLTSQTDFPPLPPPSGASSSPPPPPLGEDTPMPAVELRPRRPPPPNAATRTARSARLADLHERIEQTGTPARSSAGRSYGYSEDDRPAPAHATSLNPPKRTRRPPGTWWVASPSPTPPHQYHPYQKPTAPLPPSARRSTAGHLRAGGSP